jgi:hypothetical protein
MNHNVRSALRRSFLVVLTLVCSVHAQRSPTDSTSDPGIVPTGFGDAVNRDVRAVRVATESFAALENAVAAGYEGEVSHCVEDPRLGGMGFHHKNPALRDGNLEVAKPEILLYERTEDGRYLLTGVEYVVPISAWSRSDSPIMMGQTLKRSDSLEIWYLHAWIWKRNPSGLFADWNPRVTCRKMSGNTPLL